MFKKKKQERAANYTNAFLVCENKCLVPIEDVPVDFTESANIENINSGEPLKVLLGKIKKQFSYMDIKNGHISSDNTIDGSSFDKNFLLIGVQTKYSIHNRTSYFSITDNNRNEWKNVPTQMPKKGTVIGIREVYWRNRTHIMIKVTEIFPLKGRTYFSFYNNGLYETWSVLLPEVDVNTTAAMNTNVVTRLNTLKRNGKVVSFNCDIALKEIYLSGKENVTVGTIAENCRPISSNQEVAVMTNQQVMVRVIVQTDGKIIVSNPNEALKLNPHDYFTVNMTWIMV